MTEANKNELPYHEPVESSHGQNSSEVSTILARATQEGFNLVPVSFRRMTLSVATSRRLGFAPHLLSYVADGKIDKESMEVEKKLVLVEDIVRPAFTDGKQMYVNDPLGTILKKGREEVLKPKKSKSIEEILKTLHGQEPADKKEKDEFAITMPEWWRGRSLVPAESRFAVSWDEIHDYVIPEFAKLLDIDPKRVSLPSIGEFATLGRVQMRHLGEADTWEWLESRFGYEGHIYPPRPEQSRYYVVEESLNGQRAIAGKPGKTFKGEEIPGVQNIFAHASGEHQTNTGFRLQISFS